MKAGVIVYGFNRPGQLSNTLESLKKQGAQNIVASINVPTDEANKEKNAKCIEVAEKYADVVRIMDKPMNLNIHILGGMKFMVENYDRFIYLDDDCFPTSSAWEIFNKDLDEIEDNDKIFSRYGHYFLCPSEFNNKAITRFQGWGWATTSKKMAEFIPDLEKILAMNGSKDPNKTLSSPKYKKFVNKHLSKEINQKLNITLTRNCVGTIRLAPYWDGTLCLLTALKNKLHQKTTKRVIYNCGSGGIHFKQIARKPPYNMIDPSEVWDYYDK